jgi:hypothetical protein
MSVEHDPYLEEVAYFGTVRKGNNLNLYPKYGKLG